MEDFYLKVSPDVLRNKSDEIQKQIEVIKSNWDQLCDIIERSAGYWEGEAGDYHRKLLEDFKEDVQTVIRRLKEHPVDLLKMAGFYKETEDQAEALANMLQDDLIS